MYGYIKCCKDELKLKHLKLYSKYYCLLCTELGHNVGLIYRYLTSYDVTAFMILFDALAVDSKISIKTSCPISRIRNTNLVVSPTAVDFSLLICLFMALEKVEDNCSDERSRIWKVLNRRFHKNKKFQRIVNNDRADSWHKLLERYYEAERDDSSSFDQLSNFVGEAYGKVFSDYAEICGLGEKEQQLYRAGFNIGKYVYLMDAYDDYFDDIKKRRFNPIVRMNDYESIKDDKRKIQDKVAFITGVILGKVKESIENVLDQSSDQSQIFMNIINDGMKEKFSLISSKYSDCLKRKNAENL